ncbi:hypothetical protein EDB81DRAFT_390677 [Dactylonectria macrodidyma]|uniref:Uncharacterized protein n=1 Tax=Dactylonectria macrodidyma TaxID=307937 RepID=A0A9P9F9N8_9HYPO|nr:hypothetical protein EDB81DRAFT_390677 [Dactylonectria macrodidyma]
MTGDGWHVEGGRESVKASKWQFVACDVSNIMFRSCGRPLRSLRFSVHTRRVRGNLQYPCPAQFHVYQPTSTTGQDREAVRTVVNLQPASSRHLSVSRLSQISPLLVGWWLTHPALIGGIGRYVLLGLRFELGTGRAANCSWGAMARMCLHEDESNIAIPLCMSIRCIPRQAIVGVRHFMRAIAWNPTKAACKREGAAAFGNAQVRIIQYQNKFVIFPVQRQ